MRPPRPLPPVLEEELREPCRCWPLPPLPPPRPPLDDLLPAPPVEVADGVAAELLEGMVTLVRHRTIGRADDTRDLRADRMQMVEVVALTATLLAAAYIGWLSWCSSPNLLLVQRDPETVAKARPAHFRHLLGYREDGVQHSRRCYRHSQ